jgi:RNA polymerase sigma-70 factor, ECF subfamily
MTQPEIRAAYHAHSNSIYRFAWRMSGSAEAAEDILQECFLWLLRNPNGYDPARAPLRPFLLAVARNLVRKRWRTEQRWDELDEEAYVIAPVDPAAGETAGLVGRAVQSLPPLQREALILFEYEEFSLEETARLAGVAVGTVKARLHRARENLARMLAPLRPAGGRRPNNPWNP